VRVVLPAGCYAFGGPSAHLAVFHDLFVKKLKWLKDDVSAAVGGGVCRWEEGRGRACGGGMKVMVMMIIL
jgi:hypothetical protein